MESTRTTTRNRSGKNYRENTRARESSAARLMDKRPVARRSDGQTAVGREEPNRRGEGVDSWRACVVEENIYELTERQMDRKTNRFQKLHPSKVPNKSVYTLGRITMVLLRGARKKKKTARQLRQGKTPARPFPDGNRLVLAADHTMTLYF